MVLMPLHLPLLKKFSISLSKTWDFSSSQLILLPVPVEAACDDELNPSPDASH